MGPADTLADTGRAEADSANRSNTRHEISMDGYLVLCTLDIGDAGQVCAGHVREGGLGLRLIHQARKTYIRVYRCIGRFHHLWIFTEFLDGPSQKFGPLVP